MKFFFISIILFVATHALAQIPLEEIKVQPKNKFYDMGDAVIHYPVVVFDHGPKDQYLNQLIAQQVIGNDYQTDSTGKHLSLKEQVTAWGNDGLENMNYTVKFFKNDLLSIKLNMEGTGAYPTSWSDQINIDLRTKKILAVSDIIDKSKIAELEKNLHQQKLKQIADNILELKNEGVDSVEIQEAIDASQECMEDDSIDNFLFSERNIQFVDDCDFPHAIQSMSPVIELSYQYSEMKNYLKREFLKRILE